MIYVIANYRPFEHSKEILRGAIPEIWNRPTQNFTEKVLKIAVLAIAILALIRAVVIDSFATIANFVYRRLCVTRVSGGEKIVQAGQKPTKEQIQKIMKDPYPNSHPKNEAGNPDNVQILKDSIAFAYELTPGIQKIYDQMIANMGYTDDGENPDDIFFWTAKCFLIRSLIHSKYSWASEQFYPLAAASVEEQNNLVFSHQDLSNSEKSSAILQALIKETTWELSKNAKNFLETINRRALAMTQEQGFRDIYSQMVKFNVDA